VKVGVVSFVMLLSCIRMVCAIWRWYQEHW